MKSPILHVDMDAFFAAVEQRDNPLLKGKPVIVGGDPSTRGVVSAASYEARSYGVRSAMPLREARDLCKEGVFLKGDLLKYSRVSSLLMDILYSFTPVLEKVSIDEAFLDVRGCEGIFGESREIAGKIKKKIEEDLGLTASVGVAPNKLLAKIASDLEKPDGLVYVKPDDVKDFLKDLEITRLLGVGEKTARILKGMGVYTIGELVARDPLILEVELGRLGRDLHTLAQGIDDRPVEALAVREKSMGHEITFPEDLSDEKILAGTLLQLSSRVSRRLRKGGLKGRTLTLKVRFCDFKTITRCSTFHRPTYSQSLIYDEAIRLLSGMKRDRPSYRLLGLSMSNLMDTSREQLSLFSHANERDAKEERLMATMDSLKDRYGDQIIKKGGTLFLKDY